MTGTGHIFVEWKEEFISQERGHRVVHYFLKDSAGESILAVVGTERSVRHLFYVVAEEFVQAYGAANSIHSGFKWKSRREVVDWLTSMLSKQHRQCDWSKSPKRDFTQAWEYLDGQMNEFGVLQAQSPFSRNLSGHNSDIVWSGIPWTCGKQLKHYPAFCRNGTKIAIQSFVFVMAKGQNHYVAYLEDMYEDKRGQKKVKVRWFHHNQEVKGVIALRNPHPKEVFITPYSQVISAECVDGLATVLTREHFEECLAAFPNALSTRLHLCFRQFRSNKIKPFDLRKLRGYFDQPIFFYLNSRVPSGSNSRECVPAAEENEELNQGEKGNLGAKRPITGKRMFPLKLVKHHWQKPLFQVDEKIELLCQDSGLRGCWFRCTVVQLSKKLTKVQYDDFQDEDEYGNLEEWIPTFKLVVPDKLGMRCLGRQTIRPAPSWNEQTDLAVDIGSAVDAWWSDGWWEGVVTGINGTCDDIVQIYFPGEKFSLNIHKKDVRISRDWVGGRWIDIPPKPDILSAISESISLESKMSISSDVGKDVKSDVFDKSGGEVPDSTKVGIIEEEKSELVVPPNSDHIMEDMDIDDGKKPVSSFDNRLDSGNGTDISHAKGDMSQKVGHDKEGEVWHTDDVVAVIDIDENGQELNMEVSETDCRAMELMAVTA